MRLSVQRNKAPSKSCSVLRKALKSSRTGVCQSNDSYNFGPALSKLAAVVSLLPYILDVPGSLLKLQIMQTDFFVVFIGTSGKILHYAITVFF